ASPTARGPLAGLLGRARGALAGLRRGWSGGFGRRGTRGDTGGHRAGPVADGGVTDRELAAFVGVAPQLFGLGRPLRAGELPFSGRGPPWRVVDAARARPLLVEAGLGRLPATMVAFAAPVPGVGDVVFVFEHTVAELAELAPALPADFFTRLEAHELGHLAVGWAGAGHDTDAAWVLDALHRARRDVAEAAVIPVGIGVDGNPVAFHAAARRALEQVVAVLWEQGKLWAHPEALPRVSPAGLWAELGLAYVHADGESELQAVLDAAGHGASTLVYLLDPRNARVIVSTRTSGDLLDREETAQGRVALEQVVARLARHPERAVSRVWDGLDIGAVSAGLVAAHLSTVDTLLGLADSIVNYGTGEDATRFLDRIEAQLLKASGLAGPDLAGERPDRGELRERFTQQRRRLDALREAPSSDQRSATGAAEHGAGTEGAPADPRLTHLTDEQQDLAEEIETILGYYRSILDSATGDDPALRWAQVLRTEYGETAAEDLAAQLDELARAPQAPPFTDLVSSAEQLRREYEQLREAAGEQAGDRPDHDEAPGDGGAVAVGGLTERQRLLLVRVLPWLAPHLRPLAELTDQMPRGPPGAPPVRVLDLAADQVRSVLVTAATAAGTPLTERELAQVADILARLVMFGWNDATPDVTRLVPDATGGIAVITRAMLGELSAHRGAGRITAADLATWWTRLLDHERDFHLDGAEHTGLRHDEHAAALADVLLVARAVAAARGTGVTDRIVALADQQRRDTNSLEWVSGQLGVDSQALLAAIEAAPHLTTRTRPDGVDVLNAPSSATAAGFGLSVPDGEPALSLPGPGGDLVLDGRQVGSFAVTQTPLSRFDEYLRRWSDRWLLVGQGDIYQVLAAAWRSADVQVHRNGRFTVRRVDIGAPVARLAWAGNRWTSVVDVVTSRLPDRRQLLVGVYPVRPGERLGPIARDYPADSAVRIRDAHGNRRTLGSGVLVRAAAAGRPALVLTALHVIEDTDWWTAGGYEVLDFETISLADFGADAALARTAWQIHGRTSGTKTVDLALLAVDLPLGLHAPAVPVRDTPVRPGELLVVRGYPGSYRLSTQGPVTSADDSYFAVAALFGPRISGGPAFDEAGYLVGIAEFVPHETRLLHMIQPRLITTFVGVAEPRLDARLAAGR
ncbi:MAG: Trypsin-like peptidase domain, partial [Pseudonocardiales bacterium]|nr:Trypsin-like peptidase domain [Pseudonocardiales bacterium]